MVAAGLTDNVKAPTAVDACSAGAAPEEVAVATDVCSKGPAFEEVTIEEPRFANSDALIVEDMLCLVMDI